MQEKRKGRCNSRNAKVIKIKRTPSCKHPDIKQNEETDYDFFKKIPFFIFHLHSLFHFFDNDFI
ncbi:MAG: hypothetical protein WC178_01430 [Candidatus Paceibacterota bacterium]